MTTLKAGHEALKGRTMYLKSVTAPADAKRLLVPASANRKMGAGKTTITRGRWRGMPLYLLTLEERKTCPKSCQQWANCYGNNMPFAKRINATSPAFLGILESEVKALSSKHSSGFVVRLHVLGDFFSVGYVNFWAKMAKKYPEMKLYGYTHRTPKDKIGQAIQRLNAGGAWVRFSDLGGPMSANVGAATGPDDIQCPQEVGKTESCLTCGLCWQTERPIKFTEH